MKEYLISKYKPKYLSDFYFDNAIIDSIKILIDINQLNILLFGSSGSGKSSLIEVIISAYYDFEIDSTNILSISSLHDQGISYFRNDVKTFCQSPCSIKNKKKLVIIDDIDTLNEQSQQTFRNCLDKYNDNICFILSCSNMQKVNETIQSRTNIIRIPLPKENSLYSITDKICKEESILIDEEVKTFIIKISNYSFKTLINYIEKIRLFGDKVDINIIRRLCTNISFDIFDNYCLKCEKKLTFEAIKILYDLYDSGNSVIDILDSFFIYIKCNPNILDEKRYKIIKLICKRICNFYNIHENEIELAFLTMEFIKL